MTLAAPSVNGTDVVGSAITSGNNNGTTTLLNSTSASSGYTGFSGGNNAGAAVRAAALDTTPSTGSTYFEVTLTPQNGTTLTLNEISFGSRVTGTGPQAYTVRTSSDAFATNFATGSFVGNGTSWILESNTGLSLDFSSALTFRIYGHGSAESPDANIANWRIDDLTFTMAPPAGTPVITVGSSLPAFTAFVDRPSPSQSFSVAGANLTAAINLAASAGFEVSSDNITFSSAASLPSVGGTGYARVASASVLGPISGNIMLTSTSATAKSISLTGSVNDPNVLSLRFSPSSISEDSQTPAIGTVSLPLARAADLEVTLVNANPAAATLPLTTVTITAGQLSATFHATAVSAPSSFVNNSSLITASAAGLTDATATLNVTNVDISPITVIPLTTSPYAQNFDGLGTRVIVGAVSSTIGTQASLGVLAGTALNGWYVTKIAGTGTTATSISSDNGSASNGLVYDYGAAGAPDRALGLLASGSNTMAMGALITNSTGRPLTSLSLSMTAEFWHSSTVQQNTLTFGYGKISNTITQTNFLSMADAGVLPLAALNIVGPLPVSSNGAIDGNTLASQAQFNNISLPLMLAPGESAFIRWQDADNTGADAGLAIDNLTITDGSSVSSGYSVWIDGFFVGVTDPLIIGFEADPDFDGTPNGVEALIGSNPNSPGVSAMTELVKDGNTFTFLYPQARVVPFGVIAAYEWSTDLLNWQTTGQSDGVNTIALAQNVFDDDGVSPLVIYQVTATSTVGNPTKLFVRVVAKN
jgi:hypothetical protein